VDVILEYDLPVLVHCGWGVTTNVFAKNYSASWHWVEQMGELASAYPEMRIVIGHTGGRSPNLTVMKRSDWLSPSTILIAKCPRLRWKLSTLR
jgi:predicted TIM-barrel fold metal-dependent hydrolase